MLGASLVVFVLNVLYLFCFIAVIPYQCSFLPSSQINVWSLSVLSVFTFPGQKDVTLAFFSVFY